MRFKNRTNVKDDMEFFPEEEAQPVIFKMKQLKAAQNPNPKTPPHSPDTIFSALVADVPPKMKLPKSSKPVVAAPPIAPALLPFNAVWGGGRKIWASRRETEVLDQWLDEVVMSSRARMPSKAFAVWSDKERADKSKHRGLTTKYWIKKRAEMHAALVHDDTMHVNDKLHRINNVHDDGDDGDIDGDTLLLGSSHKHRDVKPRKQMERRAKVRRAARCAARDSKCFAWDDPVEAEAVRTEVSTQLEHEASKRKELGGQGQPPHRAAPTAVRLLDGTLMYTDEVISTLLMCYVVCCEPKGPAVADLRSGGVALSMAATRDLEDMLPRNPPAGIRKRAAVAGKDDALPKSGGSSAKARAARKKGRGTKQLLVAPKSVNAYAGKRGC